jgi:hypothetical protein
MKAFRSTLFVTIATLAATACSQDEDTQETAAPVEPAAQSGYAEEMGRQIDEAVLDLQQRAREAETRIGDKLIEVGKSIKEDKQNGADGTQ